MTNISEAEGWIRSSILGLQPEENILNKSLEWIAASAYHRQLHGRSKERSQQMGLIERQYPDIAKAIRREHKKQPRHIYARKNS